MGNPQFLRKAFHQGFSGPAPPPPGPVLLSADSFTITGGRTGASLGSTNGAGTLDPLAWAVGAGTWGLSTDQARTSVATNNSIATVNLAHADVDIRMNLALLAQSVGLVFRYTDTSNYYVVRRPIGASSGTEISKRVLGVTTQIAFTAGGSGTGTWRITVVGSAINFYRNGSASPSLTVTDTSLPSATKHGLYIHNTTGARIDDWAAYST